MRQRMAALATSSVQRSHQALECEFLSRMLGQAVMALGPHVRRACVSRCAAVVPQ